MLSKSIAYSNTTVVIPNKDNRISYKMIIIGLFCGRKITIGQRVNNTTVLINCKCFMKINYSLIMCTSMLLNS